MATMREMKNWLKQCPIGAEVLDGAIDAVAQTEGWSKKRGTKEEFFIKYLLSHFRELEINYLIAQDHTQRVKSISDEVKNTYANILVSKDNDVKI